MMTMFGRFADGADAPSISIASVKLTMQNSDKHK
jgi:hypothetical protein